jgi:hypothetical protein
MTAAVEKVHAIRERYSNNLNDNMRKVQCQSDVLSVPVFLQ